MRNVSTRRLELNGAAPTADELRALALAGYGHFTAMQIRDGKVRGLALHLARLEAANAELFGTGPGSDQIRACIRHALGAGSAGQAATADASVRVHVQQPDPDQPPSLLVTVRPPGGLRAEFRLQSVPYQRSVAHIKHLGDFGQHYYGLQAERHGFDDALLTGPDGLISEGAMTNIGFFDGNAVIWPAAAMLRGITMQLLQQALERQSGPARHSPVRLAELGSFASVFACSSRGIAAVTQVDDRTLPVDGDFMAMLADCYQSAAWDPV
jgi:branched-subunit amino acid aminotransferase/4-amino-4-deoxychorismate lyase